MASETEHLVLVVVGCHVANVPRAFPREGKALLVDVFDRCSAVLDLQRTFQVVVCAQIVKAPIAAMGHDGLRLEEVEPERLIALKRHCAVASSELCSWRFVSTVPSSCHAEHFYA